MNTRRLVALSALTLAAFGSSVPAVSAGEDEKIISKGGAAWF